jgi:hypothetical protein
MGLSIIGLNPGWGYPLADESVVQYSETLLNGGYVRFFGPSDTNYLRELIGWLYLKRGSRLGLMNCKTHFAG